MVPHGAGAWDGLLCLHKPVGPTSHDVVDRVRRVTGERRVGHSGTLDPGAEGLLLVALGRATRLIRFLPAEPKRYRGTFRLGWESSTDDASGQPLTRHAGPLPALEAVAAAAAALEGRSLQVPPAVSARRVGGERLYALARRGEPVTAPARPVEVHGFEVSSAGEPDRFAFRVSVSAGTYVRALVRDVGRRLGCGGVLETLVRTAIGELTLEGALPLGAAADDLAASALRRALLPLEALPLTPPPLHLDAEARDRFLAGRRLPAPGEGPGWRRALGPGGALLGIGELRDGVLAPRVVLAPALPGPRAV